MARRPNQILPRKGMHTYKPCVTQKRCRNPQPTYQRGIDAIHIQNCVLTWNVRTHTRPSSTWKGASHRRKVMQWMHANYNAISTNMQWSGYLQICMIMQYDAIYWGKCNGSMLQWKCMTMHYDAMTMIATFPILPTGWYTRLVQYPELRRRHAASTYGASIQISSRG